MKTRKSPIVPAQVTREEAAIRLGCSPRSIDYLRADGRLKFNKFGNKAIRISVSEIDRLAGTDLSCIRPPNKKAA
jgi:hypothetical protein